jgi:protein SCO1
MRRSVLCLALIFLPLLVAAAPAGAEIRLKAGAFSPPRDAPDFSLRGSDGSEITLSQFKGRVVLLSFGFTFCPEVCPTTLGTLAQVRQDLGPVAKQVQVIFVTVDPERDDVETMRNYVTAFDDSFIGGTGTREQLASIRTNYGVTAIKVKEGDVFGFDHSSSVYLIDALGKLRGMMPYGRQPEDFVHDIKRLLAE